MKSWREDITRIALSFIRAFTAAVTLGQIPSGTRGAQAVLVGALIAGGAAALRTAEAILARRSGGRR